MVRSDFSISFWPSILWRRSWRRRRSPWSFSWLLKPIWIWPPSVHWRSSQVVMCITIRSSTSTPALQLGSRSLVWWLGWLMMVDGWGLAMVGGWTCFLFNRGECSCILVHILLPSHWHFKLLRRNSSQSWCMCSRATWAGKPWCEFESPEGGRSPSSMDISSSVAKIS